MLNAPLLPTSLPAQPVVVPEGLAQPAAPAAIPPMAPEPATQIFFSAATQTSAAESTAPGLTPIVAAPMVQAPPAMVATPPLPLAPPTPMVIMPTPLSAPLPQPSPMAAPLGNQRILIIEDDDLIAQLYQQELTHNGFVADIASDGLMGKEKLQSNKYDLVLLDLMLPKENGLNILKTMKQEHRLPDVPVIILSNLDSGSAIDRGLELGALNYLVKANNSPADITAAVRTALSK